MEGGGREIGVHSNSSGGVRRGARGSVARDRSRGKNAGVGGDVEAVRVGGAGAGAGAGRASPVGELVAKGGDGGDGAAGVAGEGGGGGAGAGGEQIVSGRPPTGL